MAMYYGRRSDPRNDMIALVQVPDATTHTGADSGIADNASWHQDSA